MASADDTVDDVVLLSTFHMQDKRCRVYLHRGVLIWETERRPHSNKINSICYYLYNFRVFRAQLAVVIRCPCRPPSESERAWRDKVVLWRSAARQGGASRFYHSLRRGLLQKPASTPAYHAETL